MAKKIIVMTQGHSESTKSKTGISIMVYRPNDVVAVLDSEQAGKTADQVFKQVKTPIPFISSPKEMPEADTLMIGIAPAGGNLPAEWKPILLEAIEQGMDICSGLHDFLCNDKDLSEAAKRKNVTLFDIRKNNENFTASGRGFNDRCLRVHTVGHDCAVGKMVASLEIDKCLKELGQDSTFIATGQTGIMIVDDGCPVDAVVCDFLNGAVEKLCQRHQDHDFMLIEGQGSLFNPKYSSVTLGILHGARPQALIMVYEAARKYISDMPDYPVTPIPEVIKAFEIANGIFQESKVIGIAINGRGLSREELEAEKIRVGKETGLPVCDVYVDGAMVLAKAVLDYRNQLVERKIIRNV